MKILNGAFAEKPLQCMTEHLFLFTIKSRVVEEDQQNFSCSTPATGEHQVRMWCVAVYVMSDTQEDRQVQTRTL